MVFVIVSSNEVTDENFEDAKDFVRSLVSSMDIAYNHTRVGVAVTEVGAYRRLSLNEFSDKGYLMNAIDLITRTPDISTSLSSALAYVRNNMFSLPVGARTFVPDIIYVIAPDSLAYDTSEVMEEIGLAKDADIFMGMVLYGSDREMDDKLGQATDLVSAPYDRSLVLVTDSGSLPSVKDQTLSALCVEIPGNRI